MVGRARARALALLTVLAIASPARGDDPSTPMKFSERGSTVYVTASVTSLFDAAAYDRLENGLVSTVVIRMWVYTKDRAQPIAFQLLQRQVVYDLWDEVYQVALSGPGGRRTFKVKFKAEALKLMTSLDQVPIADTALLPVEQDHVLAVVAELNPVSQETLAEVRRWLSQGTGGGLDRGGSFFGSFVSVFVNLKVPDADRVIRLHSQPFYRQRKPRSP